MSEREDPSKRNKSEDFDSDDFGLPDISPKEVNKGDSGRSESNTGKGRTVNPSERSQRPGPQQKRPQRPENRPKNPKKKSGGGGAAIIIILVILLLGGGLAAGYFFYLKPKQEEEARIQREQEEAEEQARLEQMAEEARQDSIRMAEEAARMAEEETKQYGGGLNVLTERTGQYYVVVASFIDEDMANDYAEELSEKGESVFLLKREKNFSRVAVDVAESFNDANQLVQEYKPEFGDGVWVLRF